MTAVGPLLRVVQTCVAAPSQWDAWTVDGRQLYLRYRHGRGRVELGDGMADGALWTSWTDHGGVYDSYMDLETFMAKAQLTLAEGADVVPHPDLADDDPRDDSPPPAPGGPPTPFLQGTFALYKTPDGGIVLAYRARGTEQDRQMAIPPFVLQMAGQASGLSPEAILTRIQSGNLDG